jgi:hypothetical protein
LLGLIFDPDDGGDIFLRNVAPSPNCMALEPNSKYISTQRDIGIVAAVLKYHVMKKYGGVEIEFHEFLIWVLQRVQPMLACLKAEGGHFQHLL